MPKTPKGLFSLLGGDDVESEGGDFDDAAMELRQSRRRQRCWLCGIGITFVLVVVVATLLGVMLGMSGNKVAGDDSSTASNGMNPKTQENAPRFVQLEDMVQLDNIRTHLQNLEKVARANDNTRVMGSTGYNASLDYVLATLKEKAVGLDVRMEEFSVNKNIMEKGSEPQLIVLSESPARHFSKKAEEVAELSNTGFGNVTGYLIPAGGEGCNATTDYEDISSAVQSGLGPVIALVLRGTCTFATKMSNARDAGAKAVVIYNKDGGDLFRGTLGAGADVQTYLPSLGISGGDGLSLAKDFKGCSEQACEAPVAMVAVRGEFKVIKSHNILADTQVGDDTAMVVIGSHLDSVEAGPGINDNGSGSATVLELAVNFMRVLRDRTANKVRFAWWGGEESGLLGSRHHVTSLNSTGELWRVALNLNFDMLASPNYITGVYNGSDPESQEAGAVPGSTYIQRLFERYFKAKGEPWEPSAFNGRSDYGPFLEHGIPAGGLDTGAEVEKDMDQRRLFGGLCRTAFDPCYHQECDDVDNIAFGELGLLAGAVAHVLQNLSSTPALRSALAFPLPTPKHKHRRGGGSTGPAREGLPYQGPHLVA